MTKAVRYGVFTVVLLLAAIYLSHLHTSTRWLNEAGMVASILVSCATVWMSVQLVREVKRGPRGSDG